MNWEVHIHTKATKELSKFPKKDKERIIEVLLGFKDNPYSGDLEKIDGEKNTWRRRVGSFRILYDVNIGLKLVEIRKIKRRASNTY